MAASKRGQNSYYPVDLNPFGEDEEKQEYPDHLSPFGEEGDDQTQESSATVVVEDYDDSLNPFGDEVVEVEQKTAAATTTTDPVAELEDPLDESNPFADEDDSQTQLGEQPKQSEQLAREDRENKEEDEDKFEQEEPKYPDAEDNRLQRQHVDDSASTNPSSDQSQNCNSITTQNSDPQPESLELPPPPVPLPRTKSLLKKEQRNKQLMQQQHHQQQSQSPESSSFISTSSNQQLSFSNSTASISDTSLPREKKKRNAPPVPINYKRQVSGSLEDIEAELNDIGDKLAAIESESNICQDSLKETHQVDEVQFARSRAKYIELIKRKNSISRRQKELMYRKRELKLDQIHSDIEYELRMIGNKQLSARTLEDESREKELLKKLVEIVEEKNDIFENLNKESSSDSRDIEEAFRRLNLVNWKPERPEKPAIKPKQAKLTDSLKSAKTNKSENCDRNSLALGNKFSKIATLLPKGGTIKGTMKLKRKHLFKKTNSHKSPDPTETDTTTVHKIER